MAKTILPAEWAAQSAIQLTWPHAQTDWKPYLSEAIECFRNIVKAIIPYQKVVIVAADIDSVKTDLHDVATDNILFYQMPTNDTWARDHGAITVLNDDKPALLDFQFNGWGKKFDAHLDNNITHNLYQKNLFTSDVSYVSHLDFVLEGGSIESDGQGTLLTTIPCLLEPNRNPQYTQCEIEAYLKLHLGAERVLWLQNGFLEGDDTDSHIDTLARLCSPDTIAYVQCTDKNDVHYEALQLMEQELLFFKQNNGEPYHLVPLPMADAVYFDDERLPATYANFLIINQAVLVPTYGTEKDEQVLLIFKNIFPDREIIGINCSVLIKQHGSLHCVTMQFPEGVIE